MKTTTNNRSARSAFSTADSGRLTDQPTNKQQSFWKEYWYVALGIFVFVALIVAQILRMLTPREVPIQENTWEGITPGYTSLEQLMEKLGEPIGSENTNLGTAVYYQSEFPAYPDTIVVDNSNTVQFIKEHIPYDENHLLSQYIEQFGQPDLELIDEQTGPSATAYVFLSKGIVIVAHANAHTVEQKWYFDPTTRENFLRSWGQNLTDEAPGPETFEE